MNSKNRKFINDDYLDFIRQLPCAASGIAGEGVQPHHADVIGRQGIRNDYYTIPLMYNKHIDARGHITRERLEERIGEDPRDLIIFYLSMYIEKQAGRYDPEMDQAAQFLTLRRKSIGKE